MAQENPEGGGSPPPAGNRVKGELLPVAKCNISMNWQDEDVSTLSIFWSGRKQVSKYTHIKAQAPSLLHCVQGIPEGICIGVGLTLFCRYWKKESMTVNICSALHTASSQWRILGDPKGRDPQNLWRYDLNPSPKRLFTCISAYTTWQWNKFGPAPPFNNIFARTWHNWTK